jgi:hypothetical protein
MSSPDPTDDPLDALRKTEEERRHRREGNRRREAQESGRRQRLQHLFEPARSYLAAMSRGGGHDAHAAGPSDGEAAELFMSLRAGLERLAEGVPAWLDVLDAAAEECLHPAARRCAIDLVRLAVPERREELACWLRALKDSPDLARDVADALASLGLLAWDHYCDDPKGRSPTHAKQERPEAEAVEQEPLPAPDRFEKDKGVWQVSFAGKSWPYPTKHGGFGFIAELLRHPERSVPASDLRPTERSRGRKALADVMDEPARKAALAEIQRLTRELEDAVELLNEKRADQLREELEQVQKTMRMAEGYSGKKRSLGSTPEQNNCKAVMAAIRRAIQVLKQQLPELANHLSITIESSGSDLRYAPSRDNMRAATPSWLL